MQKTTVFIVDDHDLVRVGLKASLEHTNLVSINGSFKDAKSLLAGLKTTEAEMILLDYSLSCTSSLDGMNLIRHLRIHYPEIKIVVLTALDFELIAQNVIAAGAKGFLSKQEPVDTIIKAIRIIMAGGCFFQPTSNNTGSKKGADLLSPREMEVIRCCLEGMKVKDIACKFHRSPTTISNQKQAAFYKLGIQSDRELFMLGLKL